MPAAARRRPESAPVGTAPPGPARAPDEPDAARAQLQEAARLSRDTGDATSGAIALGFLAILELRDQREAEARALIDEVTRIAGGVGYQDGLTLAQMVQGDLNVTHAEYDRARACCGRSPRRFWQEGHLLATASTLEQFASLEAEAGADELAAGLTGAVDALCDSLGIVLPVIWSAWWSAEPAGIRPRARAGEQPIAAAWAEGQLRPLADAVALVASAPG